MRLGASKITKTILVSAILSCCNSFAGRPSGEPLALPVEEQKVVFAFQRALKDEQWHQALALCSERVQNAAAKYRSAEVFFKDVVPISQILEKKSFGAFSFAGSD